MEKTKMKKIKLIIVATILLTTSMIFAGEEPDEMRPMKKVQFDAKSIEHKRLKELKRIHIEMKDLVDELQLDRKLCRLKQAWKFDHIAAEFRHEIICIKFKEECALRSAIIPFVFQESNARSKIISDYYDCISEQRMAAFRDLQDMKAPIAKGLMK
jgi:hypothetical protein